MQQSVLSYGYVTVGWLGGIVRCLSNYLIAGVDTVSIVVYTTICVWLSYGNVTVAYLPAGSCLLIFCFVLFSGVSCFCLCYYVVVKFKGKEIK